MYIRESKTRNKKTGKVYLKHALVESVRTERGPRQRVVLTLGVLNIDREHWKDLARSLETCLTGAQDLMYLSGFELPEEVLVEISRVAEIARHHHKKKSKSAPKADETPAKIYQDVNVQSLQNMESRSLGPELVAAQAWELLEFEKILGECGFDKKEQALAAAAIWGRLIKPGSDLATWRWLREESSLSEFFPADISRVHKDRIYEIADKLLGNKDFLEKRLYERQNELFPGRESLFLFDLTNFYFEGKCEGNDLAQRGKSKEKRQQNPLVSLALIVDQDGFPVKSKVYKGNIGEPVTLKEILDECGLLDCENELFRPVIAMDRGIATKDNITLLQEHNFPYAVIERADRRQEYAGEFLERQNFESIYDSKGQEIQIKKVDNKVLCASSARREKENAMALRWIKKADADLKALQRSIEKGTFKKPSVIKSRLKKIKERYPGWDDVFEASCSFNESNSLIYSMKDIKEDESRLHGCYVIEFSKLEGDAEFIWRTYTTLTQVEAAFRAMKTDLGTRPVYHQGAERTEAHLFLSILAYHMLINIEYRLKACGEHTRWHILRELMATHRRSTICWQNKQDEIWHKRVSSSPEARHLQVYGKLQIKDPLHAHIYKP
jgi:transposase